MRKYCPLFDGQYCMMRLLMRSNPAYQCNQTVAVTVRSEIPRIGFSNDIFRH